MEHDSGRVIAGQLNQVHVLAGAVGVIAQQGMAQVLEVNPDLMGAAGVKHRFDQGSLAQPLAHPVAGEGFAAALLPIHRRHAFAVRGMPRNGRSDIAGVQRQSRSMAIAEARGTRREQAVRLLDGGLVNALAGRFQVRMYRMGSALERIGKAEQLRSDAPATHIGETLTQVVAEAATLPVGAVVLISDGADNSGGIDLATISGIRRQRIPVHTIGLGRERLSRDVEVAGVQTPARALAGARIAAQVTIRERGYTGTQARLTARDGGKVLASRLVTLKADGAQQTETLVFDSGPAGARTVRISVDPLAGEENLNNNALVRVIQVEAKKPRVLYVEGEPRWEFKFIRRAFDDDQSVKPVTMLRTTQNKIYRQGLDNPKDLEEGFPAKVEELFDYQAIVIGSVEAAYFTPAQLDIIKQFVDRRGGGLLFLAGRSGLSDGGWHRSVLADLLPVTLPDRKGTFRRDPANVELTPAGRDSLVCRIEEDAQKNEERWRKLPYIANFQDAGTPKPGAVVLAEYLPTSKGRFPLLVTENYGRGRTAVFASAGSWRWQMLQPVEDRSHEMFWQQLFRWLADSPGRVVASTPEPVLEDESRVPLRAEVRDTTFLPASDARVEAHIQGPDGAAATVELHPDPLSPGVYTGERNGAPKSQAATLPRSLRGAASSRWEATW